jgi:hypothetical protein
MYILTITVVLMCQIALIAVIFNMKGISMILNLSHITSDFAHVVTELYKY